MDNDSIPKVWKALLTAADSYREDLGCSRWLKQTLPASLTEDTLVLNAEQDFTKRWIEDKYLTVLQQYLSQICGHPMKIEIQVQERAEKEEDLFPEHNGTQGNGGMKEAGNQGVPTQEFPSNLSPKYVFENFVIGNSNRFAHAASLAVAENPAKVYNPLFLYSDSGLGKTHLMNAIGNRIHQNHPEMKILYTSSETFTNELINSIQNNTMEAFRNKYRNIDVLLIDDIQFLRKKESTQEEFFHTFETLHKAEKQIIISSDRKPSELDTLEDRLTSRFGWGLIADIQPPDLETRIAILNNMAKTDHIEFPNSVINLIASNISTNIRELEGAYTKVRAYAQFSHQPITEDLAVEALKDLNLNPVKKNITVDMIQQYIVSVYKISMEDLLSKKRTANVAFPRQLAMYLARELTDLSLPRIGECFGGKDHSTVMHAHAKIVKERKKDNEFDEKVEKMIARLKS
jgi:chromosomal replication initiator protein